MFPTMPETVRAAMLTPVKQMVDFNSRMFAFQRAQATVMEEQVHAVLKANRAAYDATVSMIESSQDAMVGAFDGESAKA